VRELGPVAGGRGGGKKHLAQLGTQARERAERVVGAVGAIVRRLVSK
jgi:alanyl-tRNA synthetase